MKKIILILIIFISYSCKEKITIQTLTFEKIEDSESHLKLINEGWQIYRKPSLKGPFSELKPYYIWEKGNSGSGQVKHESKVKPFTVYKEETIEADILIKGLLTQSNEIAIIKYKK
jgi:hypothetical protein